MPPSKPETSLKSYHDIIGFISSIFLSVPSTQTAVLPPVITVETSKSEAFPGIASRSGAQEVGMHGPLMLAIAMRASSGVGHSAPNLIHETGN